MIYLRLESNLLSTEGICGGKLDVESEYSSFVSIDPLEMPGAGVRRSLWSKDGSSPVHDVCVIQWTRSTPLLAANPYRLWDMREYLTPTGGSARMSFASFAKL